MSKNQYWDPKIDLTSNLSGSVLLPRPKLLAASAASTTDYSSVIVHMNSDENKSLSSLDLLKKEVSVDVDVPNLQRRLSESLQAQEYLKYLIFSLEEQNKNMSTRLQIQESCAQQQEVIHQLKLRERSMLMRELSEQLNETRAQVIKEKNEKETLRKAISQGLNNAPSIPIKKDPMNFSVSVSSSAPLHPGAESRYRFTGSPERNMEDGRRSRSGSPTVSSSPHPHLLLSSAGSPKPTTLKINQKPSTSPSETAHILKPLDGLGAIEVTRPFTVSSRSELYATTAKLDAARRLQGNVKTPELKSRQEVVAASKSSENFKSAGKLKLPAPFQIAQAAIASVPKSLFTRTDSASVLDQVAAKRASMFAASGGALGFVLKKDMVKSGLWADESNLNISAMEQIELQSNNGDMGDSIDNDVGTNIHKQPLREKKQIQPAKDKRANKDLGNNKYIDKAYDALYSGEENPNFAWLGLDDEKQMKLKQVRKQLVSLISESAKLKKDFSMAVTSAKMSKLHGREIKMKASALSR